MKSLVFYIPEAWKRYPFRAEPLLIGRYREYSPQVICFLFIFQNTVEGRIAYFPVVGRLDCESSSKEHIGFWQLNGYGLVGIYKSDWTKFGGEWNLTCLWTL